MYQVEPPHDQLLVILSDIEMGMGGPIDDFPHDGFLAELLGAYSQPRYAGKRVDLIFNGDTFDLLKTPHDGAYPHHISGAIALRKFDAVAAAHPLFFKAVRDFLDYPRGARSVSFIVGNHDYALVFPEVQERLKALCGGSDAVRFPGFRMDVGDVHIEHGCQVDPLFRIDELRPFVFLDGESCLNLPWASVTILDVVMPMQHLFCALDRIKPKKYLFEVIPDMKELLLGSFWRYWTKDFLREYMRSADPLKKVTWGMFKEVFKRSTIFSPDLQIDHSVYDNMASSERYKIHVLGHMHEPCIWSYGTRRVLQTGCIRDEFMLEAAGKRLEAIPKSYAHVALLNGRAVGSMLLETHCSTQTRDTFPPLPQTFIPTIRDLLGSMADRVRSRRDIEEHEKEETETIDS